MSVRRETIILEMEDRSSRTALGAVGPLQALNAELAALDGRATTASRRFTSMTQRADKLAGSMGNANTALGRTNTTLDAMGSVGLVRFGKQTDTAAASIDRFSGRAALLGTAIAAIGPAAIPIGAAAVPALVSLVAGMGAAAGAAGVLMLAFNGVGEAVTAVSDYRLEPTAQNLAKVQEEMERLGPAGAQLVMTLDELSPALLDLQQTAREGMFPGFDRGLRELSTQVPGVRKLVADLSSTVGQLGEASADAITNDADWQEFFDHIGSDGASALEDFGRATGNFAAGVANVVEALTEISGDSGDLVETARSFREWADNLEHTEGFKEFAGYVRESGPQVADFLAATGKAMVGLVEAAAPWGQVVLPALTALAEVFAALASSPIGPPLFTAAAALLAISKASALLGPGMNRVNTTMGAARTNITGFGRDVRAMSTEFGNLSRAQSTAMSFFSGTSAAAKRTRESLKEIAPTAVAAGAGIAAVGALSTGAADKVGLTNTATLTLAGSMAGPWGAAVGAGVGLLMDFSSANNDAQKAVDALGQALNAGEDFDVLSKKLEDAEKKVQDYKKSLEFEGLANGGTMGEFWDQFWGNSKEPLSNQAEENTAALKKARREIEELGKQQVIDDSVAGRTDAVGDAIERLGEDAISTAASARDLSAALDGLLSPEQDLIAAQDQMSSVLNNLKNQIDGTNKSLVGSSDAAIKNRAAISEGVTAIKNQATAQAAAGESSLQVAVSMDKNRTALIQQAAAAGLSRKQTEALINQMNLTPETIRTAFEAAGIEGVDAKTQALLHRYNALPPRVQTDIALHGVPKSEADIQRLTAKYHLTPRQVRTLAALKDDASPRIAAVIAALRAADGQSATTTITTVMRTVEQTAAINRERANGGFQENGRLAFADGGYGTNGRYYSRTPQIIPGGANILWGERETGWEAYISGKPSERDRNLDILAMAADRLGAAVVPAAIGQITAYANGGAGRGRRRSHNGWEDGPVYKALWQASRRTPDASLIAGMTVKQLTRLGKSFDNISEKSLKRFSKGLGRAADLQEKQTDRARDRFEKVRDRRNEIGSSIAGGLRGDLWSDNGGSAFGKQYAAGSLGAVNAQLRRETGQGKQFQRDVATLRKKGLNGAALEEIIASGDSDRARMYASASRSDVQTYERLYNARQSATAAAGRAGGAALTPEFNALRAELNKQLAEAKALNKQIAALRKEQGHRHDSAQKSRKDNGAGSAARKGARDR